jgi:hypothetical protein
VYLVISVVAGALTGLREGALRALLVGIGFAGVFLIAGGIAVRARRQRIRRIVLGGALAVAAPLGARVLGGDARFLAYGLVAIIPAGLAGYLGERLGYLSSPPLAFAVTALVVAAPSSACAGGATPLRSWLLLALLAPFFAWRTWRTREMIRGEKGWTRERLKVQGWREAGWALGWTVLSVVAIHLVA